MFIRKQITGVILSSFILSNNLYADSFSEIVGAVQKLCKAPSEEKSSHYKVSVNGEATLRVKIIGLVGGDANFSSEEWQGVQRVLREHQASDNEGYRNCSMNLTPLFLNKFQGSVELAKNKESNNSVPQENTVIDIDIKNQTNVNGGGNTIGEVNTGDKNVTINGSVNSDINF